VYVSVTARGLKQEERGVTSSFFVNLQEILAKIGPRYQLQYKIDLALQKLSVGVDGTTMDDTSKCDNTA